MSQETGTICCLKCRYSLRDLMAGNCPECGHPFNPKVPGTFGLLGQHAPRWLVRLTVTVSALHLVPLLLLYATYLTARLLLGRWPRAMMDDPKAIPGLGPIHHITAFSMGICFPLSLTAIVLIAAAYRRESRTAALTSLALVASAYAVSTLLVTTDPGNVFTWFMD